MVCILLADSAEAAVSGTAPQAGAVRPPAGLRGLHAGPLRSDPDPLPFPGGRAAGGGAAAVAGQLPALPPPPAARLGRGGVWCRVAVLLWLSLSVCSAGVPLSGEGLLDWHRHDAREAGQGRAGQGRAEGSNGERFTRLFVRSFITYLHTYKHIHAVTIDTYQRTCKSLPSFLPSFALLSTLSNYHSAVAVAVVVPP